MNLLPQSGQTGEVAVGDHASPCRPLLATPLPSLVGMEKRCPTALGRLRSFPHYEVPPSWGPDMAAAIILL